MDKQWHVYVGQSLIGTLIPTGCDDTWYYADFNQSDAWGNFAPWFQKAAEASNGGDDAEWNKWYSQLTMMGLAITADDGESHANPTLNIDGQKAWFTL
jgi:hypothetical protein